MQKAVLYTPFLRITGSEDAPTHVQTKCIDISGSHAESATTTPYNYLLAPFDCTVKYIDKDSNSVFFESVDLVIMATGEVTKVSFRCAHMDENEWDLLKMYVGRKFFQGEVCYFEGRKVYQGSIPKHIHIEFGKGLLTTSGGLPWKKQTNGNYTITTTGNAISIYDACYLHRDVIMQTNGNPADTYLFKYSDTGATVSASTYVFNAPTTNCNMHLTVGPYTLRSYPGGPAVASGFVFNAGAVINVLGFNPIKHTDGKFYYRAKGTVNGVTKVGYMQYDPNEVYPSGTADKLFMKFTQAANVRSSMDKTTSTNIIRTLQPGDLEKPVQFINCAAGDYDNGWVRLQSGSYVQYDANNMYPFGTCKY